MRRKGPSTPLASTRTITRRLSPDTTKRSPSAPLTASPPSPHAWADSGRLFAAGRWDEVLEEGKALRTMAEERGDSSAEWIVDFHINMIRVERGERLGAQDALVEGWPATTASRSSISHRSRRRHSRRRRSRDRTATPHGGSRRHGLRRGRLIAHLVRARAESVKLPTSHSVPRCGDPSEPYERRRDASRGGDARGSRG